MQFYFTEEDEPTRERAIDIRAQLVHAHHEVRHGMPGAPAPPGTDVWFHGLAIEGAPPMSADVVATLVGSSTPVALFQLCDGANMSFERVPPELAQRTRLFLRNHWPRDESLIPEQFRGRLGFMPPMVKAMAADPGKPLDRRRHDATFFAPPTSSSPA